MTDIETSLAKSKTADSSPDHGDWSLRRQRALRNDDLAQAHRPCRFRTRPTESAGLRARRYRSSFGSRESITGKPILAAPMCSVPTRKNARTSAQDVGQAFAAGKRYFNETPGHNRVRIVCVRSILSGSVIAAELGRFNRRSSASASSRMKTLPRDKATSVRPSGQHHLDAVARRTGQEAPLDSAKSISCTGSNRLTRSMRNWQR